MVREKINPSELENALMVLPEPTSVHVTIVSSDYLLSKLVKAGEKLVGVLLEDADNAVGAWIKNPTKQKIMYVYRDFYGKSELEHPDFLKPRLELCRINWHIEKPNRVFESEMFMVPEKGFDIQYWGEEPRYVSQLRQVLSGTQVPLKITANDYSKFGG